MRRGRRHMPVAGAAALRVLGARNHPAPRRRIGAAGLRLQHLVRPIRAGGDAAVRDRTAERRNAESATVARREGEARRGRRGTARQYARGVCCVYLVRDREVAPGHSHRQNLARIGNERRVVDLTKMAQCTQMSPRGHERITSISVPRP